MKTMTTIEITDEMVRDYRDVIGDCVVGRDCILCDREARKQLTAALPIIEQAVRKDEREQPPPQGIRHCQCDCKKRDEFQFIYEPVEKELDNPDWTNYTDTISQ